MEEFSIKTDEGKTGVNRMVPVVIILMLLVSVGYLAAGSLIMPDDSGVSSADCDSLNNSFEIVRSDGNTENITLPASYEPYDDENEKNVFTLQD